MKTNTSLLLFLFASTVFQACKTTSLVPHAKIQTQEWTIENLSVSTFRNGDTIFQANSFVEWTDAAKQRKAAWCYYSYDTANAHYGKLYNWFAVADSRGLAPVGYHIPSDDEFKSMVQFLGEDSAAYKLKNTSAWKEDGNGNNSTGFSGLPAGGCGIDGVFDLQGTHGGYWTSTAIGEDFAWYYLLAFDYPNVHRLQNYKWVGLSVRCIKDQNKKKKK